MTGMPQPDDAKACDNIQTLNKPLSYYVEEGKLGGES
jgi:hypothetical protein